MNIKKNYVMKLSITSHPKERINIKMTLYFIIREFCNKNEVVIDFSLIGKKIHHHLFSLPLQTPNIFSISLVV